MRLLQTGAEWLTTRAGGLNRYVDGLSRGVAGLEDGEQVEQQWLVMGDEPVEVLRVPVEVVARPGDSLLKRWAAMRHAFLRQAFDKPPDVVATHFALYALPTKKYLGKFPHVVHFHGPWAAESTAEGGNPLAVWAKRMIEKSVYRTGNRFITLSQAFADILTEQYGVNPSKVRVVPGGVDVDRYDTGVTRQEARQRLGWAIDRPTIICVRRLVHRMGLEQLIEAMASVHKAHPDAVLKIAGKGPITADLQAAIDSHSLGDAVELLGFVPDEDLPYAYRAADLSIVPSQSLEGFGLIIPESLAAGTPALVTPVGGMPEVVRGLDPKLILESNEVGAIAQGLSRALSGDLSLPSDTACQAYARDHFDWPVIARRVLDVYREAMEAHV